MKKLLLLILLLQTMNMFAQKYSFDYMLKSENNNNGTNFQSSNLVNSKNHNIYMELAKNKSTNSFYAILIDYDNRLIHYFRMGEELTNPLKLSYENRSELTNAGTIKETKFKIEKVSDLNYRIYTADLPVKNKDYFEVDLLLAPFEDDLIIINFELLSRKKGLEIEELLKDQLQLENLQGNFYIKEINYKYLKKASFSSKIRPEKYIVNLDVSI